MRTHQPDEIRYCTFELFDQEPGLIHAVFARHGGISPMPWASLNVGGLRGDDPARVMENRVRAFRTMGRDPDSVYDVWQVHSADVICIDRPRPPHPHVKADAILTNRPEITLFMRFGDCVPILLFDPVQGVVGLAHAGWLGTVRGKVSKAVEGLQSAYGSRPEDIIAAIGPSIGAHHYEVGPEVVSAVRGVFNEEAREILPEIDGATHFDLWAANRLDAAQRRQVGRRNNAPSGLYPTKGGGANDYIYITVSRANPEHWSRLMKLVGREDLIEDPRFKTANDRVKNEAELDAIIGEWTKQHDKRAAMEKLIAVSVPAGAVFDTMELHNEPSFVQQGFMHTVQHHNGPYKMATWPVRVDGKMARVKGSPGLGTDTPNVLSQWLGIDAGQLAALKSDGVI